MSGPTDADAALPLVRREERGVMSVLVLDSPSNRNALSRRLVAEMVGHLHDIETDPAVRVVAMTATGSTFCSGADLNDPPVDSGPDSFASLLGLLWEYPKPLVVAVNGHVRAGGFGLVASADVVICSSDATFALTEVRLGLVPAVISVPLLRRMSPLAAHRYLLTGERFDAEDAVRAGLVGTVVEPGHLWPALDAVATEFAACEPRALEVTRALLRQVPEMDVAGGLNRARQVSAEFFASPAAAAGIAAFKERRPPPWAV